MINNKKILFINTSTTAIIQYPADNSYPLGVMSLAAYLREKGYSDVSILDFNIPGSFEDLERYLQREKPSVVGLSGLSMHKDCMDYTAKMVKKWNKDCLVISGGPYASASPQKILNNSNYDLVIIGEGELTLLEILENHFSGKDLKDIKGTGYRDETGKFKKALTREPIMNLDELPYPAYDLIDVDFYSSRPSMAGVGIRRYISIFSSRACPYRCTFCHDIFGKTFRALCAEKMVEQIEYYMKTYNLNDFEFMDDIWNLDRKRVRRFCELIIEKGINIRFHFPNAIRMDLMDEEILTLIRQAGGEYMCVSVESASTEIQKDVKKHNKLEKIQKNIEIAHRLGFFTMGYFMVGFPKETYRQVLETCRYLVTSKLSVAMIFCVTPFEGTELYKETGTCEDQNFEANEYLHGKFHCTKIPQWLLKITISTTYLLFYLQPARIFTVFTRHPRKKSLPVEVCNFIVHLVLRIGNVKKKKLPWSTPTPTDSVFQE